jgi:type VI secretion system protein ImpA
LAAQISEKGGLGGQSSENEPDGGSSSETGQALHGDIRNSQDVIIAIEKICDYYKKNEPSSPVPILLERAQRLVNMDFMSIVRDLASEGVSQVETFIGEQEEDDD